MNLAIEDSLSETVIKRLLKDCGGPWAIGTVYGGIGVTYLARTIRGFNHAAKVTPFIVLADLDADTCVPEVLPSWLPHGAAPNMVLRFAVREVESWLLADAEGLSVFLGIAANAIPVDVELLDDPKRELVNAARRSRRREVLDDIVPAARSTAVVGRGYNARLAEFVNDHWDPHAARLAADSLNRAMTILEAFEPVWV
ncbi:MAG: DUF4276 family protein [Cyanobacteria bacterium]|nr:DUF4276 family protein [Cyanobacteriota bacterium]